MHPTLFDSFADRPRALQAALDVMAASDVEARGAVFTRRAVVDFMLDLSGYTQEANLAAARLLEPSCGEGEFVLAAAERLMDAYLAAGGSLSRAAGELAASIRAVELHRASSERTHTKLVVQLARRGLARADARRLADAWLVCDDFLLTELPAGFTHIVGNPPYVRQELIPDVLLQEYRHRFKTIYDRADLYIPFLEKGLKLLAPGGVLTFICSDRWMKNRYGGPLRQLVAGGYHLRCYVDMVDTPAFEGDVTAYPAIFAIAREPGTVTRVARRPEVHPDAFRALSRALRAEAGSSNGVTEINAVARGGAPWLLDEPEAVVLLRHLEARFPLLEEAGCEVGIGVATGADRVFIGRYDALPVEDARKLPLVMAPDLQEGQIVWRGMGIVNPYEPDGTLARLEAYPCFARYVRTHEAVLRRRHTAQQRPERWYKTIDRIYSDLTRRPKLLIPDIKGTATVVYDEGAYYPHHNLYYVVADAWDLRALQAVLRSSVAEFFVAMYCVKMRGGYLRFQAQYLRRIRLPRWEHVPRELREQLTGAAGLDRSACDEAAFELYGLDGSARRIIASLGEGGAGA